MPTMMLQYKATEAAVPEVISAVEATFAALEQRKPKGLVRFTYYRKPGTAEFVGVLELEEGVENPLLGIEAARALVATVTRVAVGAAPMPVPLELVAMHDSRT
ncbi:hypothetical protein KRR26_28660 [Corallococcus sp. M34]|uniref:hypothetical protein n=1 Tax=Citreicoccus inhibens TaxID=2849499 RepID=UPI001C239AE3|nr:hypothetical protein [Citreicoccus inhibens]MBU8899588.1 hypothetical protein [Citreicoccus inhibens]